MATHLEEEEERGNGFLVRRLRSYVRDVDTGQGVKESTPDQERPEGADQLKD